MVKEAKPLSNTTAFLRFQISQLAMMKASMKNSRVDI
jgi:hypothetical protein